MRSSLVALAVVVLTTSCQSVTGPADAVLEVVVSATSNTRTSEGFAAVPFVLTNRGSETLYLRRCGNRVMTAVDREEAQTWIVYSSDACPALDMSSLALPAGESVESVRPLGEAGRYRLRVGVASSADTELSWTASSNAFHVH